MRRVGVSVVVAGAVALAAATAVTISVIGRSSDHGTISAPYPPTTYCYRAPTPADQREQASAGIVFGLDLVVLSSRSAHVTVTSVVPVASTSAFRLLRSQFVPGGTVSEGGWGSKPLETTPPVYATMAREVPAKLTYAPPPIGASNTYDGKRWQLAVTVASATDSSAAGFVITYQSGSTTRQLTTHSGIAFGPSGDSCR